MTQTTMGRKSPRDFVFADDLWEADANWDQYFVNKNVWVYMDEYRANQPGEVGYARIIIHSGHDTGWKFSRPIEEKELVHATLKEISKPVSQKQLNELGFTKWLGTSV